MIPALGTAAVAAVLGSLPLQVTELVLDQLPLVLLICGLALVGAEALAPGGHLMVLGVALLTAGIVGLALGTFLAPVFLAAVLAPVVIASGAAAFYVYREFDFYGGKGSGRTSDSSALRGKTGRATERITHSSGEVKLDEGGFNPYYAARALDREIEEGEEVLVTDPGGGNVVTVESLSMIEDDEIDRALARGHEESADERERETA
ncbi:NfeD family protein [Halococcus salsus]|uniref:NfeD family protein n=1 Tax=Halococcus salsus TaxID=2162894 RepID=UPI001358E901|nr:NfeD family protein [Halococcus salsus]